MNDMSNPSPSKYAWFEVDRAAPPKSPARQRVGNFKEVYSLYDEETAQAQASRCIQCPDPLCMTGCPLCNRIPEWIALVAEGRFLEAAEVSQSTSNMPEICSRVCPQERLCEQACLLNARSEPVAIGALEKFLNEYAFAHGGVNTTCVEPNGRRVAVVGSGPGGLACADELVRKGYAVTVFESQSDPGGLLLNGIPAFKLDKSVVGRRIDVLRARGVKFVTGTTIGEDISLSELQQGYDAVFIGIGAQKPKELDVPGADLQGVMQALPFLVEMNAGDPTGQHGKAVAGKRVIVLGGGDTAMDCLRTAVRCGAAHALCLYRRDLRNMPGNRNEFLNALEEGARFQFLSAPVAVEGDESGRVTQVRCIHMELGEPDASGRRRPKPVKGSEFVVPADVVLVAYGFDPVPLPADSDFGRLAVNDWGALEVNEDLMTSLPGVFAGGDTVRGPSLVVHAVLDGRRAAAAMDRYVSDRMRRRDAEGKLPAACIEAG